MGIGKTFASRIGGGGVIFSAPRICKLFAHPNTLHDQKSAACIPLDWLGKIPKTQMMYESDEYSVYL